MEGCRCDCRRILPGLGSTKRLLPGLVEPEPRSQNAAFGLNFRNIYKDANLITEHMFGIHSCRGFRSDGLLQGNVVMILFASGRPQPVVHAIAAWRTVAASYVVGSSPTALRIFRSIRQCCLIVAAAEPRCCSNQSLNSAMQPGSGSEGTGSVLITLRPRRYSMK